MTDTSESPAERAGYLEKAIAAYHRGMEVDLNDYYPASNLPQLYRQRNKPGDRQLAMEAEVLTAVPCRAAILNGSANARTRSTLLANAFDRGDVDEAVHMAVEVEPKDCRAGSSSRRSRTSRPASRTIPATSRRSWVLSSNAQAGALGGSSPPILSRAPRPTERPPSPLTAAAGVDIADRSVEPVPAHALTPTGVLCVLGGVRFGAALTHYRDATEVRSRWLPNPAWGAGMSYAPARAMVDLFISFARQKAEPVAR
jgi:hypothetical protein